MSLVALHVSHSHWRTHKHKHTRTHSFTVLHPGCDIAAHTRWPTVWLPLVGQPVVQRSQHSFQTLTWLTLHCSHVRVQARTWCIYPHERTHTHTSRPIWIWMKSICAGCTGKCEVKNGNKWNKREKGAADDERSKCWVEVLHWPQRAFLLPLQWSVVDDFSSMTEDCCSFLALTWL